MTFEQQRQMLALWRSRHPEPDPAIAYPRLQPLTFGFEPWHYTFPPLYVLVSDPDGLGDPVVDWGAP